MFLSGQKRKVEETSESSAQAKENRPTKNLRHGMPAPPQAEAIAKKPPSKREQIQAHFKIFATWCKNHEAIPVLNWARVVFKLLSEINTRLINVSNATVENSNEIADLSKDISTFAMNQENQALVLSQYEAALQVHTTMLLACQAKIAELERKVSESNA